MTSIEEFRMHYLRLCKDHHIEAQDAILQALKSAQQDGKQGGYSLNLSTQSLSPKTCAVLAKVLTTDRAFTHIYLNDCMLPEEGAKAIAHGLGSNAAVKKLEMKGNNIRGSATEALGRMVKSNNSIVSLCLEWNSMGMLDTMFGVFCEGLSQNNRIQSLDLRNNQITHTSATDLAAALKRNSCLRSLDLRWNNIGLLGGRAILSALQHNRTLVKLELAGNNVPNDVLKSIESCISHNADRTNLNDEHCSRQKMLSKQLQQTQRDKTKEVSDLLDRIDRQESTMRQSTRGTQQRILQLQEALDERRTQFNNLASKMSLVESELAMSEAKVNELSVLLNKTKEEQGDSLSLQQKELKRERENKALSEAKLNKEIIEFQEKNFALQNKVDEVERKCRSQQENIFELKEQLTHSQAELKLRAAQFDEKIQAEKQRTKDNIRDADDIKQKEMERVRREAEETEKMFKDRINKLESTRLGLEEEISHLKASSVTERLSHEEQLLTAKKRIKAEEEQRFHQLEEKLRVTNATKDELQSHCNQQGYTISDLQTKNANLQLEIESLKHKMEDLNTDLAQKSSEIMTETTRVRNQMNQRIQKLESERQSQQDLYDRIGKLEKDLHDLEQKHKTMNSEKDLEISRLTDKFKQKDFELTRLREEDAQRSSMLQNAIQNYVTKSPYMSTS